MANVNTISFTTPDLAIEQRALERQRRLAEALQQQASAPIEQQTAGGYVVPFSPMQGIAKIAQAYSAALTGKRADERERELATEATSRRARDFAEALRAREGSPERFIQPDPQEFEQAADQGGESPAGAMIPAKPGSTSAMYAALLRSQDPMLQQMGMAGMMKQEDEKYGHDVKFTQDGRPYLVGDRGQVKWLDPQAVTPRDKLEFVNTGNAIQPVNPYTAQPGAAPMPMQMRPGEVANLQQRQFEWANPSAHQRVEEQIGMGNLGVARGNLAVNQGQLGVARGNQALKAADTYYNTGMAPLGVPGVPSGVPGGAPGVGTSPNAPQLPPVLQGGAALTPKQRAELEKDRPQEQAKLRNVGLSIDNAIAEADKLLDPRNIGGVSGVTGPVMGRIPSILGSSTNAQAGVDTLKSQIGVQVLTAMREASKTGGAVGNVTEKEWPILQNQLGALQQSQTTGEFLKNLKGVRDTLARVKQNAQQSYETVYGPFTMPSPVKGGSVMDQADAIIRGNR